MPYTYEYPRPAVAVDCAIFKISKLQKQVLLIKRAFDPYKNCWAFPGGFLDLHELLIEAAKRELFEETGLSNIELYQYKVLDTVNRDPRGRTLGVLFYGFTDETNCRLQPNSDAAQAQWFDVENLPPLAFDHNIAIDMLKNDILAKIK